VEPSVGHPSLKVGEGDLARRVLRQSPQVLD
jgi:hypothetical protein